MLDAFLQGEKCFLAAHFQYFGGDVHILHRDEWLP